MKVLFEDNHLIAVQKRPGEIVQGDRTGDTPLNELLKDFLKEKYQKPGNVYVGTLHRLDRPVSGLVLFAKTSKAAERMSKAFAKQKIEKTYLAITQKAPSKPKGELKHYLTKNARTNTAQAHKNPVDGGKEAILHYEVLGQLEGKYLLKVSPKTGRPHQIRVQLASMGTPILGDVKYGSTEKTSDRSLYLLCYSMAFEHPVKKEPLVITASFPKNKLWNLAEGIVNKVVF